jgi:hypothetical protein
MEGMKDWQWYAVNIGLPLTVIAVAMVLVFAVLAGGW